MAEYKKTYKKSTPKGTTNKRKYGATNRRIHGEPEGRKFGSKVLGVAIYRNYYSLIMCKSGEKLQKKFRKELNLA